MGEIGRGIEGTDIPMDSDFQKDPTLRKGEETYVQKEDKAMEMGHAQKPYTEEAMSMESLDLPDVNNNRQQAYQAQERTEKSYDAAEKLAAIYIPAAMKSGMVAVAESVLKNDGVTGEIFVNLINERARKAGMRELSTEIIEVPHGQRLIKIHYNPEAGKTEAS